MGTGVEWLIPLAQAADYDERWIGGKAAKLARLARAGFRVPDGFVITTRAYEHWVERQDLARLIRMELGRKPFASMRWEEIWDVALRIRSGFLAAPIPPVSVPGYRRRRRGVGNRQTTGRAVLGAGRGFGSALLCRFARIGRRRCRRRGCARCG